MAACRRCNTKKEDRTPAEVGLPLWRASPSRPGTASTSRSVGSSPAGSTTSSRPRLGPVTAPIVRRVADPLVLPMAPYPLCPNNSSGTFPVDEVECWWHKRVAQWRKGEEAWPNCSARTATSSTPKAGCRCRPGSAPRSSTGRGSTAGPGPMPLLLPQGRMGAPCRRGRCLPPFRQRRPRVLAPVLRSVRGSEAGRAGSRDDPAASARGRRHRQGRRGARRSGPDGDLGPGGLRRLRRRVRGCVPDRCARPQGGNDVAAPLGPPSSAQRFDRASR